MAIIYKANIMDIFLLSILIIALVAGSVSTLGAVFPIFIIFAVTSLFFLILNFSMLDMDSHNMLMFIIIMFSIFFISSGYKNYQFLTKYILLKKKEQESQEKLKKLNERLETNIKIEVEKNRQKDKQLQHQSKMAQMGEMIGAIAHQWRQPLNELSTGIQNLKYDYKEGLLDDEKYIKTFIDKNKKTISFMSQTIDDFRDFFRVEKDKKEFDILEATKSVVQMQSAQLKEHNIVLHLNGEKFNFLGLESEYQQVILNIISNAKDVLLEKNIENPTITIEVKSDVVTIEDNAGGIQQNILDRIFEPYFTTKEQGKGTGLGLYMSKMIIEDNMGGELSVRNNSNGAIFEIYLKSKATIKEEGK